MNQIIPEIIYPANREKYTIMIYQAKNFCVKRAKICTSPGPAAASKYQKDISIKSCPVKSFVQNKQSSASSPVHFCFSVTNLLHIVFVLFHVFSIEISGTFRRLKQCQQSWTESFLLFSGQFQRAGCTHDAVNHHLISDPPQLFRMIDSFSEMGYDSSHNGRSQLFAFFNVCFRSCAEILHDFSKYGFRFGSIRFIYGYGLEWLDICTPMVIIWLNGTCVASFRKSCKPTASKSIGSMICGTPM